MKYARTELAPLSLAALAAFASTVGTSAAQDSRNPNTTGSDVTAEAPWRVESADTPIPFWTIVKDAGDGTFVLDFNIDVIRVVDRTGGAANVVYEVDFPDQGFVLGCLQDQQGIDIGGPAEESRFWVWGTDRTTAGTPLTAAALGYAAGDTLRFSVEVFYEVNCFDEFWSRDLEVHVGEAPLPTFDSPSGSWARVDTHYHTSYTNQSSNDGFSLHALLAIEYGYPLKVVQRAGEAIGLHATYVTDHDSWLDPDGAFFEIPYRYRHCFNTVPADYPTGCVDYPDTLGATKYETLVNEVDELNAEGTGITLIAGVEQTVNDLELDGFMHLISLGDTGLVPQNNSGVELPGLLDEYPVELDLDELLADDPDAVLYAAHPLNGDDGFGIVIGMVAYEQPERDEAALHPSFRGYQLWNEMITRATGVFTVDPFDLPFTVDHPFDWSSGTPWTTRVEEYLMLDDGVAMWDSENQRHLDDVGGPRKLFAAAGSDAHGDINYAQRPTISTLDAELVDVLAWDNAFGRVHTVARVPEGAPLAEGIRDAMARGTTVMSNGPIVTLYVDGDGDGALYEPEDALPGESVSLFPGTPAELVIEYATTPEYGDVDRLELVLGTPGQLRTFDLSSRVVGASGRLRFSMDRPLVTAPGWRFLRVQLSTEPVVGESGLPKFRSYSNPIWLQGSAP